MSVPTTCELPTHSGGSNTSDQPPDRVRNCSGSPLDTFVSTPTGNGAKTLSSLTLSSYDISSMKQNADGSVTLYFGPTAPPGIESNWIPTRGKRPLPPCASTAPPKRSTTGALRSETSNSFNKSNRRDCENH